MIHRYNLCMVTPTAAAAAVVFVINESQSQGRKTNVEPYNLSTKGEENVHTSGNVRVCKKKLANWKDLFCEHEATK